MTSLQFLENKQPALIRERFALAFKCFHFHYSYDTEFFFSVHYSHE